MNTPVNAKAPVTPHMLAGLTGLDRAIAWAGSAGKLGALLGVSRQTVLTWRDTRVPADRVASIEEKTGISRHVIRPDLYPAARRPGRT
jgi:DNA-binding transcriptional regulator YdaS (Cro superfamily)